MERGLDSILSASPSVDFDSGYIGRKLPPDYYLAHEVKSDQDHLEFNMALLSYQHLVLLETKQVQLSNPIPGFIPKYGWFKNPFFSIMYDHNPDGKINAKTTGPFKDIQVKFNPMYVSKIFGSQNPLQPEYNILSGNSGEYDYQVNVDGGGDASLGSRFHDDVEAMLMRPDVNGVDFASPEYTHYELVKDGELTNGGQQLKKIMEMLFEASTNTKKTMFMHIHCGEAYPVWDYEGNGLDVNEWDSAKTCCAKAAEKEDKIYKVGARQICTWSDKPCEWAKKSDPAKNLKFGMKAAKFTELCANMVKPWSEQTLAKAVKITGDDHAHEAEGGFTTGDHKHYRGGRVNMKAMLAGIQKVFETKDRDIKSTWSEDFKKGVVIVLGHSTFADEDVAKKMKELGVWGDINLSSNVATSALSDYVPSMLTGHKVNYLESLTGPNVVPEEPLRKAVADMYAAHGLKNLMKHGACVSISTDGSGTEHSYYEQEYKIAKMLVGPAGITQLEASSNNIMAFLNQPAGTGAPSVCSPISISA